MASKSHCSEKENCGLNECHESSLDIDQHCKQKIEYNIDKSCD